MAGNTGNTGAGPEIMEMIPIEPRRYSGRVAYYTPAGYKLGLFPKA